MERKAEIWRKTAETDIRISLDLDGAGNGKRDTGIGFFNHMLTLFARHGLFDLTLKASGDLDVDAHHTVEDTGIVLGQAISQALGDKNSISRYGTSFITMDEALAMVSVDLGGRAFLVYDFPEGSGQVGGMDVQLFEEFFFAVSHNAGMNIHAKVLYGHNTHHMIEAVFKAFGRALDAATRIDERISGVMSTKGMLGGRLEDE